MFECPDDWCWAVFSTRESMENHARNTCTYMYCGDVFLSQQTLNRHKKCEHLFHIKRRWQDLPGSGVLDVLSWEIFACPPSQLPDIECSERGNVFPFRTCSTKYGLNRKRSSMRYIDNVKLRCAFCRGCFRSYRLLGTHVSNEHSERNANGTAACPYCPLEYKSLEKLGWHLSEEHWKLTNIVPGDAAVQHKKCNTASEKRTLHECYTCRQVFEVDISRNCHVHDCLDTKKVIKFTANLNAYSPENEGTTNSVPGTFLRLGKYANRRKIYTSYKQCSVCKENFNSYPTLGEHAIKKHCRRNRNGSFICPCCAEVFQKCRALGKHLIRCTYKRTFDKSLAEYYSKGNTRCDDVLNDSNKHRAAMGLKVHPAALCPVCKQGCGSFLALGLHAASTHCTGNTTLAVSCPYCTLFFRSPRRFGKHLVRAHTTITYAGGVACKREHMCHTCQRRFMVEGDAKWHSHDCVLGKRVVQSVSDRAFNCGNDTQNFGAPLEHPTEHVNGWPFGHSAGLIRCKECPQAFQNEALLGHHLTDEHTKNVASGLPGRLGICPCCSLVCKNPYQLGCHLTKEHWKATDAFNKTLATMHDKGHHLSLKRHECKVCDGILELDPQEWNVHKCTDHKRIIKPLEYSDNECQDIHLCPICEEEFDSETSLGDHSISQHVPNNMDRLIVCPFCARLYNTHGKLGEHVKRVHWNERESALTYKCQKCGITFREKRFIKLHNQVFHDVHGGRIEAEEEKENDEFIVFSEDEIPNEQTRVETLSKEKTPDGNRSPDNRHEGLNLASNELKLPNKNDILCSVCEKTFKTYDELGHHVSKDHTKCTSKRSFLHSLCPCLVGRNFRCQIFEQILQIEDRVWYIQSNTKNNIINESLKPMGAEDGDSLGASDKERLHDFHGNQAGFHGTHQVFSHGEHNFGEIAICPYCTQCFRSHGRLGHHIIRAHWRKMEGKVNCEQCGIKFKKSKILEKHNTVFHEDRTDSEIWEDEIKNEKEIHARLRLATQLVELASCRLDLLAEDPESARKRHCEGKRVIPTSVKHQGTFRMDARWSIGQYILIPDDVFTGVMSNLIEYIKFHADLRIGYFILEK